MRRTQALIRVAAALMEQPDGRHWGYDLTKRGGVRSGVLYPILSRMLHEGWLVDGWEDRDEIDGKRPPRRYYELTDEGREALGGMVYKARLEARFAPVLGKLAHDG
jgi:PadR family transcriptional regulator, regulatory protein PadR